MLHILPEIWSSTPPDGAGMKECSVLFASFSRYGTLTPSSPHGRFGANRPVRQPDEIAIGRVLPDGIVHTVSELIAKSQLNSEPCPKYESQVTDLEASTESAGGAEPTIQPCGNESLAWNPK